MPFPTTPILEDFNRADENPIGGNWTTPLFTGDGQLQIISNAAGFAVTAEGAAWWNASFYGPDVEVYTTLSNLANSSGFVHLFARLSGQPGTKNGYALRFNRVTGADSDTFQFRKLTDGANAQIGSTITQEVSIGDKIGLSIIGSILTAYRYNGTSWLTLGTISDFDHRNSGVIAIEIGSSTTTRCDDFGGGTYNPNYANLSLPPPHVGRGAGW